MDEQPWFKQGLQFTCSQCGKCCGGPPGYVWIRHDDMQALCQRLALDATAFQEKYLRDVGTRQSLTELPNGDCVFLDSQTRRCSVYEARPLQCRTWPFWESNIKSEEAWKRTCQVCPGSGQGELYPLEQIIEQAAAMRL